MTHLTLEQINNIPEKSKTMTAQQIADEYSVSRTTIEFWKKELRKKGVEVPKPPHPSNVKRFI